MPLRVHPSFAGGEFEEFCRHVLSDFASELALNLPLLSTLGGMQGSTLAGMHTPKGGGGCLSVAGRSRIIGKADY